MSGIELIASERERQKTIEGWTPEHDDAHTDGELIGAAANYCDFSRFQVRTGRDDGKAFYRGLPPAMEQWPRDWDYEWWKPHGTSAIRNLVKAGALIAAEIDRLQRRAEKGTQ